MTTEVGTDKMIESAREFGKTTVTKEMVKAGAKVLKEFSGYSYDPEYRARLVYQAMNAVQEVAADHLSP